MRPIRVLALIPDAFGSHGGISKFNRDLLTALCAHPSCAEVVALPRVMPERPGRLPVSLTWVTDGLGGKLRYLSAALKTAMRNRVPRTSELPSSGFDLVICGHVNLLPAAFLAQRFLSLGRSRSSCRRAAPLLVLFMHGIDVWEPHRSALVRSLARRIDAFVSVSAFTRDRFVRWSQVPLTKGLLLPNCVDLACFEPGDKDPALVSKYGLAGRKVLMTLGRLLPDRPKGIDEVLEALPSLFVDFPQLSYLICGEGRDRPRLASKARSLGLGVSEFPQATDLRPLAAERALSPQVIFTGHIPESEKAAHYRLADAFVMPGYGEGFGIVYLEALACGIPVLASTLDASREALLDGELGLLVDPRAREALHKGILRVLRQPRGQVPPGLDHYSFPNFLKRSHAIVNQLCPVATGSPGL